MTNKSFEFDECEIIQKEFALLYQFYDILLYRYSSIKLTVQMKE